MYRLYAATFSNANVMTGRNSCVGCSIAANVLLLTELLASAGKMFQSSAKNWIRISPRKNDGIEYSVKLIAVAV